jgi:hypothetical protein
VAAASSAGAAMEDAKVVSVTDEGTAADADSFKMSRHLLAPTMGIADGQA